MSPVRGFRRLLGVILFVFMGLPLSLGGLSLLSMRGWLVDEAKYLSLVQDARFERLITAPELASNAPASFSLGEGLPELQGKAAVSALQQAIPSLPAIVSSPLEPNGSGPSWEGRPTNLAAMRDGLNAASVWMVRAGAGLCVAIAFIGEDETELKA